MCPEVLCPKMSSRPPIFEGYLFRKITYDLSPFQRKNIQFLLKNVLTSMRGMLQRQDMAEYLLESCQIEQPWTFEILTNVDNYTTKAGHLTAKVAIG